MVRLSWAYGQAYDQAYGQTWYNPKCFEEGGCCVFKTSLDYTVSSGLTLEAGDSILKWCDDCQSIVRRNQRGCVQAK